MPQQSRGFIDNEFIYIVLCSYHNGDAIIAQLDYLGRILNIYYSSDGIYHDISVEGDSIYFSGSDVETLEDIVRVLDAATGTVTNILDYKKILQRSRTYGAFWDDSDWVHINSITEYNEDVIVSFNHQSTIVKTDLNGNIKWMLADPKIFFYKFSLYVFAVFLQVICQIGVQKQIIEIHIVPGGVSIDMIHEWDYIQYLIGAPASVKSLICKKSNLEIDSDDIAVYIAEYPDKVVEIHLDYFGRTSVRKIELFGKDDVIEVDFINATITFKKKLEVIKLCEDRNSYQKEELKHFLNIVAFKQSNDNPIAQAYRTLQITRGYYLLYVGDLVLRE